MSILSLSQPVCTQWCHDCLRGAYYSAHTTGRRQEIPHSINLEPPIDLFGLKRKLEYLDKTHTDAGTTCKLHHCCCVMMWCFVVQSIHSLKGVQLIDFIVTRRLKKLWKSLTWYGCTCANVDASHQSREIIKERGCILSEISPTRRFIHSGCHR